MKIGHLFISPLPWPSWMKLLSQLIQMIDLIHTSEYCPAIANGILEIYSSAYKDVQKTLLNKSSCERGWSTAPFLSIIDILVMYTYRDREIGR